MPQNILDISKGQNPWNKLYAAVVPIARPIDNKRGIFIPNLLYTAAAQLFDNNRIQRLTLNIRPAPIPAVSPNSVM